MKQLSHMMTLILMAFFILGMQAFSEVQPYGSILHSPMVEKDSHAISKAYITAKADVTPIKNKVAHSLHAEFVDHFSLGSHSARKDDVAANAAAEKKNFAL